MTNSSCFASQRDGSINRSRKKVWRNKRSSLRKCVDFGFRKRQIGHFHEVNSIRLPITSLPAYGLLTTVCFFSALPESTVVLAAKEKSSSPSPPPQPEFDREFENVTRFSTSSDRRYTRAEICTLLLSHCRVRSTGQSH